MKGGLFLVLALLTAGCAASLTPASTGPAGVKPTLVPPVALTKPGSGGFEPSIDAAPDGTLVAAAAKTHRPNDGTRLASWIWYSKDGGKTWKDMPSPAGVQEEAFGFEGDTAIDAKGHVFFADTVLPDDWISRWTLGSGEPQWDSTRPLGTTAPLDDRPYLAAQGDGIVYLLTNTASDQAAPGDPPGSPGGAFWFYASTDGGTTWSLGHAMDKDFCNLVASPADDESVLVVCDSGKGPGVAFDAYRSSDRGATWKKDVVGVRQVGTNYLVGAPALDKGGNAYVGWLDDRVDWSGLQDATWAGSTPGVVRFSRALPGAAWETLDVTPFAGRFGMVSTGAGPAGEAAITFYATRDLTVTDKTEWRAYALVTQDATAPTPSWTLVPLSPDPVGVGANPPRDFFQNAVGPDGTVNVIFERGANLGGQPGDGIDAQVLYAAVRMSG